MKQGGFSRMSATDAADTNRRPVLLFDFGPPVLLAARIGIRF
jgi:hypothetical protein